MSKDKHAERVQADLDQTGMNHDDEKAALMKQPVRRLQTHGVDRIPASHTVSLVDWTFRDRHSGRIVVAQRPNALLMTWLTATAIGFLARPSGHWGTGLSIVAATALTAWAADEIARGANPWRRMLGAGVLTALLLSWTLS